MNAPARGIAVPSIVAVSHGIEVPAAPHLGKGMIAAMAAGRYERNEIACGLAAIRAGARVLELGAGSGLVGAVLARQCRPEKVVSVEANPDLIPYIQALYRHNRLDHVISVRNAVVLAAANPPHSVTFHVNGNFLGSGLAALSPRSRPVDVPVLRYDTLKAAFPHDTIMMDIEGGELDFLRHADLTGVNTVVFEMHRAIYGRDGAWECRRLLEWAGLTQDAGLSRAGVHVYRRQG